MLDIKLNSKAKIFEKKSPHLIKKFKKGIRIGAYFAGHAVQKKVRTMLDTGTRTGVHYRNLPNRSSAPGEPPRTQSGRLSRSSGFSVRGTTELRVKETAPYAEELELGSERIRPRLHLIVAIRKEERTVRQYLQNGPFREIKI